MDLSAISSLPPDQLTGWHGYLCAGGRDPLPGELAAILDRARQLGLTLTPDSSRAALFGSATVMLTQPRDLNEFTRF